MGNTVQKGFSPFVEVEENDSIDRTKKFWKLYDSSMNNNQTEVTIMEFRDPTPQKRLYECSTKAVESLKTLRHPYILSYKSGYEKNKTVYMATTPVNLLVDVLPLLTCSERIYGIRNLAIALQFYNGSRCKSSHNNIRSTSVYITKDKLMKWLIGDFEFSLSHSDLKKEVLELTKSYRVPLPENYKLSKKHPFAVDMYCFCLFVGELLEGMEDEMEDKSLLSFIDRVKQCTNFSEIPNFKTFLELSIFKNDPFTSIMTYMDNIRSFKSDEKEQFYKSLYSKLQKIPVEVITNRLVKRMLSVSFLTDLHSQSFLPHLFSPREKSGILPKPIFEDVIINSLNFLYESKNRSLRLKIIQTIPYYLSSVDSNFVFKMIIPELTYGIYDVDDTIVMGTMNGFVTITRYLYQYDQANNSRKGMETANKTFLPSLHHFAVKGGPVRAHAILCLVSLWSVKGIRKDVIYSVIQTGIYDMGNQEIQLHVVNALTLHFKKFYVVEIVNIVLPVLLHMSIHEHEELRQKSVKVIKLILEDNLENSLFYHDIPKLMKLPKPSSYYPGSSKADIVRSSKFTGGKYRTTPIPEEEGEGEEEEKESSEIMVVSGGEGDYTTTSGLDTTTEEEEEEREEQQKKKKLEEDEKKQKPEIVPPQQRKEQQQKKPREEPNRQDSLLLDDDDDRNQSDVPSGGEWVNVDGVDEEEKERLRIQRILQKANRGKDGEMSTSSEEEGDDEEEEEDSGWDNWDEDDDENVKKEKKEEEPKQNVEKKKVEVETEAQNDWDDSGFEEMKKSFQKEEDLEDDDDVKNDEQQQQDQDQDQNTSEKKEIVLLSEEERKKKEEEEKEKAKRDSMINDLEMRLLGIDKQQQQKQQEDEKPKTAEEEDDPKIQSEEEEEEEEELNEEKEEVVVEEDDDPLRAEEEDEEEEEEVKEEVKEVDDEELEKEEVKEEEKEEKEEELKEEKEEEDDPLTSLLKVEEEGEKEGEDEGEGEINLGGGSSDDQDIDTDKIDLSGWGGSIQED